MKLSRKQLTRKQWKYNRIAFKYFQLIQQGLTSETSKDVACLRKQLNNLDKIK